jgi:hypothetical protein
MIFRHEFWYAGCMATKVFFMEAWEMSTPSDLIKRRATPQPKFTL